MAGAVPISPELALVDPLLRADGVRALPRIEPFAFLAAGRPLLVVAPAVRHPPFVVAASVYLLASAVRFCVGSLAIVVAIIAATAVLAQIG
jgi:hypothetical protein